MCIVLGVYVEVYVGFVLRNSFWVCAGGFSALGKNAITNVISVQLYRGLWQIYLFCCVVMWLCGYVGMCSLLFGSVVGIWCY